MELKYRENSYFDATNCYVLRTSLNRLYITEVEWHNGNWYSRVGLKYKMTSVKSVCFSEIVGLTVFSGNKKGKITKFLTPNDLGIFWDRGNPLLYFWNNINDLKIQIK